MLFPYLAMAAVLVPLLLMGLGYFYISFRKNDHGNPRRKAHPEPTQYDAHRGVG